MNIYLDLQFTCDGLLKEWTLFVKRDVQGKIYLSVWREIGSERFKLVGYNRINVTSRGILTVTVPDGDRIRVKTGDILGTHFNPEDSNVRGLLSFGFNSSLRTMAVGIGHKTILRKNGEVDFMYLADHGKTIIKIYKTVSLRASLGKCLSTRTHYQ